MDAGATLLGRPTDCEAIRGVLSMAKPIYWRRHETGTFLLCNQPCCSGTLDASFSTHNLYRHFGEHDICHSGVIWLMHTMLTTGWSNDTGISELFNTTERISYATGLSTLSSLVIAK